MKQEANADIVVPADSSEDEGGDEDDEDEWEDDGEEEEKEDDAAELVSSVIGNAKAPGGYTIIEELPPMETEDELNELIGKTILYGFETKKVTGWHMGTVHSRKPTAKDLEMNESANFVVKYKKSVTKLKDLNGNVACELTARTHGASVWWVLLHKE